MREFYNKYFYIPKQGTMKEKVFLASITVSVISIVLLLSAMGFTAYAYFTANVTSASNSITSAEFKMACSITDVTDENNPTTATNPIEYTVNNDAPKKYKVQVSFEEANTVSTGFCVVSVEEAGATTTKTYHTAQIWDLESAEEGKEATLEFYVVLNKSAKVTITPHWGTASSYADYMEKGTDNELYITTGETITVGEAAQTTSTDTDEETVSSQTPAVTPETTTETPSSEETKTEEETQQESETEEAPKEENTIETPTTDESDGTQQESGTTEEE